MPSSKSTKKDAAQVAFNDPASPLRFSDTHKSRSLDASPQEEYLRYVREPAARVKRSSRCCRRPKPNPHTPGSTIAATRAGFVQPESSVGRCDAEHSEFGAIIFNFRCSAGASNSTNFRQARSRKY